MEVPVWTGPHACISLAKRWIENCHRNHKSCRPPEVSPSFLPTRLVYVGHNNSLELKLYITSPAEAGSRYLALSHCWGRKKITVLTSKNLSQWCKKMEYDALPASFQHAIYFTREIGERYIWIDSLCIVQDSPGDWEREAEKMSKVYAQAFCTISASGSTDAYGGCFKKRNPLLQFPCNLLYSDEEALRIRAHNGSYNAGTFNTEVDCSPLSKRGWTFQERLLSQRIVHFSANFLFFECSTHFASELLRNGGKSNLVDLLDQQEETAWWKLRSNRFSDSGFLPKPRGPKIEG
jgi:Heterokaryon incompatibility protein (HET)